MCNARRTTYTVTLKTCILFMICYYAPHTLHLSRRTDKGGALLISQYAQGDAPL